MKNAYFIALICLITSLLSSCSKEDTYFKELPAGPIKHHLITVARVNHRIKAQGFSGATPSETEIYFEAGKASTKSVSIQDGSFSFDFEAPDDIATGEFTFTTQGKSYQQGYQIRDLSHALNHMAKSAFETDHAVDALSFHHDRVAILSSQASLVTTFMIDSEFRLLRPKTNTVLLNKDHNAALFPSSLAFLGKKIAVSLNLTNNIALIDSDSDTVFARANVEDDQKKLFRFSLPAPLVVKNAIDADDSGTQSTTISRSTARNPEAILALDDNHFLVSFTNYYQYEDESQGQKAVVGPGVVALMTVDNDVIKTTARLVIDYKNPRYFLKKDDVTIWVVCSGAWSGIGKSTITSTDAGLLRLKIDASRESFSVVHKIPLNDFAPAIPALSNNQIIIPHFEKNDIAVIDENATSIGSDNIKVASFHREFAFTFASAWIDDIVFLGDKFGKLVAYNGAGFFPFPFIEPITIDKNVDERIGLRPSMLAFRSDVEQYHPKLTYKRGYTAWLASDSHQKVFPVDFLEVFGP